jgi:MraZ protein
MFLGTYEHNLDPKGRVQLPSRFREVLTASGDPRLVLTTNVDPSGRCLVGYSYGEWLAFQEKIASLPQFEESVIRLKRLTVAGASELTPDKQGRILIPPVLREYAALGGTVLVAGMGNCIELWDTELWRTEHERARQNLPAINATLAQFGL